jgi:hypothetical protein
VCTSTRPGATALPGSRVTSVRAFELQYHLVGMLDNLPCRRKKCARCGKICGRAGVEGRGEVIVKLVMESSMKLILALE